MIKLFLVTVAITIFMTFAVMGAYCLLGFPIASVDGVVYNLYNLENMPTGVDLI